MSKQPDSNMINRYDTFTQLTEVVVGAVNLSVCNIIEDHRERDLMCNVFESIDKTLTDMVNIFEDHDVIVHRPRPITLSQTLRTPHIELPAVTNPIAPADNYLTIADTVIQCANVNPNYYFDHEQYRHIWQDCWQQGSRWIAMPRPLHVHDDYDHDDSVANAEPLMDAPAVAIVGDHIFYAEDCVINAKGLQWLQQEFPDFTYQMVTGARGHLDSHFNVLRPGVVLSSVDKSKLPPQFADWQVIRFQSQDYKDIHIVSDFLQDDDWENTALAVNCVSLNENTVMMVDHVLDMNPQAVKQIEACGIRIIPVSFSASRWVNQGLTCMTNCIHRIGTKQSYFG